MYALEVYKYFDSGQNDQNCSKLEITCKTRPYSKTTRKALQIFNNANKQKVSAKYLSQKLNLKLNYAYQLKSRYRSSKTRQYNHHVSTSKLHTHKYGDKVITHRHHYKINSQTNYNNNSQVTTNLTVNNNQTNYNNKAVNTSITVNYNKTNNLRINDSQPSNYDLLEVIEMYIERKNKLNLPLRTCINEIFGESYTSSICGINKTARELNKKLKNARKYNLYRYNNGNEILTEYKPNGQPRPFLKRLQKRTTFVMQNHKHNHHNHRQNIEYHIGDRALTKFLCFLLDLPYKARIWLGKGHFISTDASGLDICHYDCFIHLLATDLQFSADLQPPIDYNKVMKQKGLLQTAFSHGKIVEGNKLVCKW